MKRNQEFRLLKPECKEQLTIREGDLIEFLFYFILFLRQARVIHLFGIATELIIVKSKTHLRIKQN